jgi:hypothetical protein
MTEREITGDWIDRFNNGELDDTEKELFKKRLESSCLLRTEVDIDVRLDRFLQDDELMDLIQKVRSASGRITSVNRRMNYLLLAASLLCLVMVGGLFYLIGSGILTINMYSLQPAPGSPLMVHEADDHVGCTAEPGFKGGDVSVPADPGCRGAMLAQNYVPLPEFELLVGSVTRSHHFSMISPPLNTILPAESELQFSWQSLDGTGPVTILILDNHGVLISEKHIRHGRNYCLKTQGLLRGLYYWKILLGDDMVLLGKLTIL